MRKLPSGVKKKLIDSLLNELIEIAMKADAAIHKWCNKRRPSLHTMWIKSKTGQIE